jgi:hypothetical protein
VPSVSRNQVHRQWLISLVLLALAVRALVPAGFMPATDRPFSFEICPDGFPAQLLHQGSEAVHQHHHHDAQNDGSSQSSTPGSHDHGAARAEHCVFAAAASVGPAPQIAVLVHAIESLAPPQLYFFTRLPELTRHRVQQPRAPPALS